MPTKVDLYNSTYGNFQDQVLAAVRREAFGEDIGQNSRIMTDEYDTFYSLLNLHYDGTVFHRVIDGFMIQGGGFDLGLEEKPTRQAIKNEAANGLRNDDYTVAMARTSEPHSATAQFFINVANNVFLNYRAPDVRGYGYAVFGKVVKGQEVVKKIARVATGGVGPFPSDVPVKPVVMEKVKVLATPGGK